MMPITPMGVDTRNMSRPFGRRQRASSRPTGSGRLATSATAWAVASTRLASNFRRSISAGVRLRAAPPFMSSSLAARICSCAARIASAAASSALFFCAVEASRKAAAASRAARPMACISASRVLRSFACTFMASGLHRMGERQIVAMDHLIAATIAQNALDFDRTPPHQPARILAIVSDEAACELAPVFTLNQHRIAALEMTGNGFDAGGKQTLARKQRAFRAGIDDDGAQCRESACDPAFLGLRRADARHKQRRALGCGDGAQRMKDVAIGDDDCRPRGGRDLRGGELGFHAAFAHARHRAFGHALDLRGDGANFGDVARGTIALRVGGAEPSAIAPDETTMPSFFVCFSAATSAERLASQSRLNAPATESTSKVEPTLTTMRFASARWSVTAPSSALVRSGDGSWSGPLRFSGRVRAAHHRRLRR